MQVTGVLIDTRCYRAARAAADECLSASEGRGFPVGVVRQDAEEEVWILVTAPQMLSDYLSKTVRVRGAVRSPGVLIPHRIELQTADGWMYIY